MKTGREIQTHCSSNYVRCTIKKRRTPNTKHRYARIGDFGKQLNTMDENIIKLNVGERSNDCETRKKHTKNDYRCDRLDKPAILAVSLSLCLFLSLFFLPSLYTVRVIDEGVRIESIFIYFLIQNIALPIPIQSSQTN